MTNEEKKHKNLSTRFYTVLSNDNFEGTHKLFEFIVNKFGFEKIGFSPLRGDPANPSLKSPTVDEWDQLFRMYKKYEKFKKNIKTWWRYYCPSRY